jgi:RsiW-degrading membrane proteinase PrsW (M82 family)
MELDILGIVAITLAAFIPATIYLIWIRRAEIYQRESLKAVELNFLYGATVSIGLAIFLETIVIVFFFEPVTIFSKSIWTFDDDSVFELFFLAVIVAPFVEELTKVSGVFWSSARLTELENGFIYGAATGLGFAAVENVLYMANGYIEGIEIFVAVAIVRTVSSMLLHASASAVAGYGVALGRISRIVGKRVSWIPFYLIAVGIHGLFNMFAIAGEVYGGDGVLPSIAGFFLTLFLAVGTMLWVRKVIVRMDREPSFVLLRR